LKKSVEPFEPSGYTGVGFSLYFPGCPEGGQETVAKKKVGRPKKPDKAEMDVLFIKVDPALKAEIERIAERNVRSLTGEVTIALREHVKREKEKWGEV
jgi:hypothetical protein